MKYQIRINTIVPSLLAMALFAAPATRAEEEKSAVTETGKAATAEPAENASPASHIKALGSSVLRDRMQAFTRLQQLLSSEGEDQKETIRELFAALDGIVPDEEARSVLKDMAKNGKEQRAAKLIIGIAWGRADVAAKKRGSVIFGQMAVKDGKVEPPLILAQMPISDDGYFVGAVGSLDKPVFFRSHGYAELLLDLKDKKGDVIYVGSHVLAPLEPATAGKFRVQIKCDGSEDASITEIAVKHSISPINTPGSGYSPRKMIHWPGPLDIKGVPANGEFETAGLTTGHCKLTFKAKGHAEVERSVTLKPGQTADLGTVRIFSSDLGFYLGKPPESAEPVWIKDDFEAAVKKGKELNKPVLVMLTATWCGPCKMLEKNTFSNPWVRQLLNDFVLVKMYENKELNSKLGSRGYPTLAVLDDAQNAAGQFNGYMEPLPFVKQLAAAYRKLGRELPKDLQVLAEKGVL